MKPVTRRPMRSFVTSIILMLALVTQTGCMLVAAGVAGGAAAGYCYAQGKVCQSFRADLLDTRLAARTALAELGMQIVAEKQEGNDGYLETRTTHGERVRVYVDRYKSRVPADGLLTRVCVRVATFGDPSLSTRILDQISRHLVPADAGSLPPPEVAPAGVPSQQSGTSPPPLLPPEPVPATPKQP